MKVLVTGAGGFIGSHLVEALVERGYEVKAFIHYNSLGQWGWLETSKTRNDVEVVPGDVRDYDSIQAAICGCRHVYHLAALIGIPYSYRSPLAYIKTNVEGTYNILQASRESRVERVIHTSTSEVYGTARYVPMDEDHPLQAQSPYAATKIAADQLALSFHRSFDLPVTVVRPFNTFGPRQSARAIVPTIITQVLSGTGTIKLGNMDPTRDLNFVLDTVAGFMAAAHSDKTVGEVVNVGSGREVAIGELAELIFRIAGSELRVLQDSGRMRPEGSEVERLLCHSGKMSELTGWKPRYNLEDALRETISWYEHHLNRFKADIYQV